MIVRQDEQVNELLSLEELIKSLEIEIRVHLFGLWNNKIPARLGDDLVMLDNNLGFTLEDLCAVELVWQTLENQQDGGD